MVNKVLSEQFYPIRAEENVGQQYEFSNRQASQYGSRLDWSHDEFRQSLYENSGPRPVLFASKVIICSYWPIVRSIPENIRTEVWKYGPKEVRSPWGPYEKLRSECFPVWTKLIGQ